MMKNNTEPTTAAERLANVERRIAETTEALQEQRRQHKDLNALITGKSRTDARGGRTYSTAERDKDLDRLRELENDAEGLNRLLGELQAYIPELEAEGRQEDADTALAQMAEVRDRALPLAESMKTALHAFFDGLEQLKEMRDEYGMVFDAFQKSLRAKAKITAPKDGQRHEVDYTLPTESCFPLVWDNLTITPLYEDRHTLSQQFGLVDHVKPKTISFSAEPDPNPAPEAPPKPAHREIELNGPAPAKPASDSAWFQTTPPQHTVTRLNESK